MDTEVREFPVVRMPQAANADGKAQGKSNRQKRSKANRGEAMNPYEVLGAWRGDTPETIKVLYRTLAQTHHPDKGGDVEEFQSIQAAYDILSDPERRERYDRTGETGDMPDIDGQARSNLAGTFLSLVDAIDIDTMDVLEIIRANVTQHKLNLEAERRQVQKQIGKRENMLRRLKRKSDGNDFAKYALENSIKELNMKYDILDMHDRIATRSLELLDEYEYSTDNEDRVFVASPFNWGFSNG